MGLLDKAGELLGTNKTDDEIGAQQQAGAAADQTLREQYGTQTQYNMPYYQAGTSALSQMQNPNFQKSFSMDDFQQDPGYQFQMQQGQQAIQRASAAKGLNMSGGTLKDLQSYSQGLANQDYQQAYQNYNTNQTNQFGRLSTIAGMGQNATNNLDAASMNYGNQVAGTQMGLGNAAAAAYGNEASMNAGFVNSAIGAAGAAAGGAAKSGAVACDRRLKTDIEEVSKEELSELKQHLKAYRFKYKDEKKWGSGQHVGVMTQDLAKSRLGRTLVTEDKDGNQLLDIGRVMMLFLATMAEG